MSNFDLKSVKCRGSARFAQVAVLLRALLHWCFAENSAVTFETRWFPLKWGSFHF